MARSGGGAAGRGGRARRPPAAAPGPGAAPRGAGDRRAILALGLVLALALVVRVVYVLQSRANPFFAEPAMDAQYNVEWARALAEGRGFQDGPYFRAPGYAWFLGACLALFGDGLLAPRIVQALVGTGSCALLFALGSRAFGRRAGLLAAALLACWWTVVYFDGELLSPVLEVFLDLAAILLSLRAAERARPLPWALAGIAWGLAALVRPNALLFLPPLALWVLASRAAARPLRARAACAAALAAGTLLAVLPVTLRNAAAGDRVLIATNGGVNLWIGNHPGSDGSTAIVPGTRPDWWGGYHDSIRLAEAAEGRRLKPSEVSDHYARRALAAMRADPARALAHLARKLGLFWKAHELGNNQDERFFALTFGPVLRWLPVGFGLVAPLALVGFALAARRWRELFPLWAFLPVYVASVVLFFVNARYRVPVLPVLALFAAHALVAGFDAWRAGARAKVLAGLAFAILFGAWSWVPPRGADTSDAYGRWQLGVFAMQHGDPAGALAEFEAAVRARPALSLFHKDRAAALAALGRRDEALASLARALELDPENVPALQQRFELELGAGRLDDAHATAARLRAVPSARPIAAYFEGKLAAAHAERERAAGRGGAERERREFAARAFAECLEAQPDALEALGCALGLGRELASLGRPAEAVTAFERALAVVREPDAEGWFWLAQLGRLEALAASGETASARAQARELASLHAGDARAAELLRRLDRP